MNIPSNPSMIYVAITLFLLGLFLFISGLNIITVEKIKVTGGFKTWIIGLFLMGLGLSIGVYIEIYNDDKVDNKKLKCNMNILSPQNDEKVASSVIIKGSSSNCSNNNLYALLLQDMDGDYYKQGELTLTNEGNWISTIYLGSAWSKKSVVVKVVSYPDTIEWISGINSLPRDVSLHSEIILNVE